MGLIDAFRDWLPYPIYRFVGGPFDGQDLPVTLYEVANGMAAPEVWNLSEPLAPPPVGWEMPDMAACETVTVHRYRFVPASGRINEGHYEYFTP